MNLLIIGAGVHGHVVKETAQALGIYKKIDFIDDGSDIAIGTCKELKRFKESYTDAFVAFGDNALRHTWLLKAKELGYHIPALVHPRAYVSPSAIIEEGVTILPNAVVNTRAQIKVGTIIGIGTLIDHDVTTGECCHINTGAVIMAGCHIKKLTKIDAGEVIKPQN